MDTRLLDARQEGDLAAAADLLRAGRLVAFPTETVYGLGALGLEAEAVERIFQAKGRPHTDPVILHVAEVGWVRDLVSRFPPHAEALMRAFWPGPLTLVLPKSGAVPPVVTAGGPTVAVRMPAHPVALELIRRAGAPIAAPSANLFSRPSPTTAQHVLQDLQGRIDAVLDGGPASVGVESTVLDLSGEAPVVLRPGGVTRETLEQALGGPVGVRGRAEAGEVLPSPGLLTRHYSPRAEVHLFDGPDPAVFAAIRELASLPGGVTVLAYSEDLPHLGGLPSVEDLGSRTDPESVARKLYAAFRQADERGAVRLAVRLAPSGRLGDAINDRLRRAACGRVITLG